ncbi:hypothetical protein NU219Hw_g8089t1 [Hortaea werneckii]
MATTRKLASVSPLNPNGSFAPSPSLSSSSDPPSEPVDPRPPGVKSVGAPSSSPPAGPPAVPNLSSSVEATCTRDDQFEAPLPSVENYEKTAQLSPLTCIRYFRTYPRHARTSEEREFSVRYGPIDGENLSSATLSSATLAGDLPHKHYEENLSSATPAGDVQYKHHEETLSSVTLSSATLAGDVQYEHHDGVCSNDTFGGQSDPLHEQERTNLPSSPPKMSNKRSLPSPKQSL